MVLRMESIAVLALPVSFVSLARRALLLRLCAMSATRWAVPNTCHDWAA